MNVLFKAIASRGHKIVSEMLMLCQTLISAYGWTFPPGLARCILHIREGWIRRQPVQSHIATEGKSRARRQNF